MTAPAGSPRPMSLLALVAATYFIVSGGPYGLEELIASAGFDRALVLLLLTPLLWSLPTALMVGELAAALPETGGYYAWVRRALGPFWGFQEAWLSLAASAFDMAIYPTLFVLYLGRLVPGLGEGTPALLVGLGVIWASAAINLRGAAAVGRSSLLVGAAMVAPFAALAVLGLAASHAAPRETGSEGWLGASAVAMWNFMGWDNASTFATDVDAPQRTYPRAILGAVALVTASYLVPLLAVRQAGLDVSGWATGAWVLAGDALGGWWLGTAIALGGMLAAAATFNALVLSYSRLPVALAEDGLFPRLFARVSPATGAPWPAVLACAVAYSACLGLGFRRLVELDVVLYGLSLALEFAALVVLRFTEPELPRPFRLPLGVGGLLLLAAAPLALLAVAAGAGPLQASGSTAWLLGGLVAAGPVLYLLLARVRRPGLPAGPDGT